MDNRNTYLPYVGLDKYIQNESEVSSDLDRRAIAVPVGFSIGLAPLPEHNNPSYYIDNQTTYSPNGKLRGVAFPDPNPNKQIVVSFRQHESLINNSTGHREDVPINGQSGSTAGRSRGMLAINVGQMKGAATLQTPTFSGFQNRSPIANLPASKRTDNPWYSDHSSVYNAGDVTVGYDYSNTAINQQRINFTLNNWSTNEFWGDVMGLDTVPILPQNSDYGTLYDQGTSTGINFLRPFITWGAQMYMPYGDVFSTDYDAMNFDLLEPTISYNSLDSVTGSTRIQETFDTSKMGNGRPYDVNNNPTGQYDAIDTLGLIHSHAPQYETEVQYHRPLDPTTIINETEYESTDQQLLTDHVAPNDKHDYQGIATTFMGAPIDVSTYISYFEHNVTPDHAVVIQAWNPNESIYDTSRTVTFPGLKNFSTNTDTTLPFKLGIKKDTNYSSTSLLAMANNNDYGDYTWYDSINNVPGNLISKISAVRVDIPSKTDANTIFGYMFIVPRKVIANTFNPDNILNNPGIGYINRTGIDSDGTPGPFITVSRVWAYPTTTDDNPVIKSEIGKAYSKTDYSNSFNGLPFTPHNPPIGFENPAGSTSIDIRHSDTYPGATLQVTPLIARNRIFTDRSNNVDLGTYNATDKIKFYVDARITSNNTSVQNFATEGNLKVDIPKGIDIDLSNIKSIFSNGFGHIDGTPTYVKNADHSTTLSLHYTLIRAESYQDNQDGNKDYYNIQLQFTGTPNQFDLTFDSNGNAVVPLTSHIDSPLDSSLDNYPSNSPFPYRFRTDTRGVNIRRIGQLAVEKYYPENSNDDDSVINKVIDQNDASTISWIIKFKNITSGTPDINVFDYLPKNLVGNNGGSLTLKNISSEYGSNATFWYSTQDFPGNPQNINPSTDLWENNNIKQTGPDGWQPRWHLVASDGTIPQEDQNNVKAVFAHFPVVSTGIQPLIKLSVPITDAKYGDSFTNQAIVSSDKTPLSSNVSTISLANRVVKGVVFNDLNKDGIMEATQGESGIEGVHVVILDQNGNVLNRDLNGNNISDVRTDPNGNYTFKYLPPNTPTETYRVAFERSSYKGRYVSPIGNSDTLPNNNALPDTSDELGKGYNYSNVNLNLPSTKNMTDPVVTNTVNMGLIDQLEYLGISADTLNFGKHKVPSKNMVYGSEPSTTQITITDSRAANNDNAPTPYQIQAKMRSWQITDTGVVGLQNSKILYYPDGSYADPSTNGSLTGPIAIAPPANGALGVDGTPEVIYQRGESNSTNISPDNPSLNIKFNKIELDVPAKDSGNNDIDDKKYHTTITYTLNDAP